MLFNGIITTFAQCGIEAGDTTTIICGGSAQINTEPKWLQIHSGGLALNSVYFINADTGYTVGLMGTILKTTDGGNSWITQSDGTSTDFYSVYFINSDTGYAVGLGGVMIKTINGGNSWTTITSGTTDHLYSIYFIDSNTGYAVGSNGVIIKTIDGGNNWNTQASGTTYNFESVHFPTSDTGYAVATDISMTQSSIHRTFDGGNTWTTLTSSNNGYNSVYFTNATTGYIGGGWPGILKTIDGGNNWSLISTSDGGISSIYFPTTDIGYAVTNGGHIYKTTDGGNNWLMQGSGTTGLLSVHFVDANMGYAVGLMGIILKLPSSPDSYSWSPATGLNATDIANPVANPTITTTYTVTATTDSCTAIDSVTVFVNPLTANAGMDKTIICGGTVQLDSITSNYTGTEILSYNWLPATGLNNDTIPNPTVSVTSNTIFLATVTTTNGCTAVDSVTVFVNPLTANTGMDKTIICGGTVQLDSITSNYTGNDTLTYEWLPSTGLNYDTIPNPTATVIENTTFFVTVTTPNGCNAIDSVTVFVNPLTITGTDSTTIICGNSTTLNTITNYTGTGTLTYSWLPVTGLNNSNIANPVATVASNQTYTVTVTTPNGCVATDDVNVTIIPMNAPEICIVGVDSTNKNMIVWNKPVSSAIDSFYIYRETNITDVYQKIGDVSYDSLSVFVDTNSYPDVQSNKYKISIKDGCGLESNTSTEHKSMHLSINQGMGSTWNLDWEAYEGFTVSTYNVFRGTNPDTLNIIGTSSGSNTQYSDLTAPSGFIYYQVEVISPNSCNPSKSYNSSRSNIATNNGSGIDENNYASDLFSIYPNPATDIVTLNVDNVNNADFTLNIYNVIGKLVRSELLKQNQQQINVGDLSNGTYMIEINSKELIERQKLTIQR